MINILQIVQKIITKITCLLLSNQILMKTDYSKIFYSEVILYVVNCKTVIYENWQMFYTDEFQFR